MASPVSENLVQIRAHLSSTSTIFHGLLFGLVAFAWAIWTDLQPSLVAGHALVQNAEKKAPLDQEYLAKTTSLKRQYSPEILPRAPRKTASAEPDKPESMDVGKKAAAVVRRSRYPEALEADELDLVRVAQQVRLAQFKTKLAQVEYQASIAQDENGIIKVEQPASSALPPFPIQAGIYKYNHDKAQDSNAQELRLLRGWISRLQEMDPATLHEKGRQEFAFLMGNSVFKDKHKGMDLDANEKIVVESARRDLNKNLSIELPIIKLSVPTKAAIPLLAVGMMGTLMLGFVTRCRNWTEITHCARRHHLKKAADSSIDEFPWLIGRLPWWMGSLFLSVSMADMEVDDSKWPVRRFNWGMCLAGITLLAAVCWLGWLEWCGAELHRFAEKAHHPWGAVFIMGALVSVGVFVFMAGVRVSADASSTLSAYPQSMLRRDMMLVAGGSALGLLLPALRCGKGRAMAYREPDVRPTGSLVRIPRYAGRRRTWVEMDLPGAESGFIDRRKTGGRSPGSLFHFAFPTRATPATDKVGARSVVASPRRRKPPSKPYLLHPRRPHEFVAITTTPAQLAVPGQGRVNLANAGIICEFHAVNLLHKGKDLAKDAVAAALEWALCGIRHDLLRAKTAEPRKINIRIYDLAAKLAGHLESDTQLDFIITSLTQAREMISKDSPQKADIASRLSTWARAGEEKRDEWKSRCQDVKVLKRWQRPRLPHEV